MSQSHDTTPSVDDLQFALQEVRTVLLQQILATETGLLSVAELVYRNRGEADIGEENVRYHLREMTDRGIVAKQRVPPGQRVRDLPNTFFRVTSYGEAILEQANLLAEADIWAEVYGQMERTEEIQAIEEFKRNFTQEVTRSAPLSTEEIRQLHDVIAESPGRERLPKETVERARQYGSLPTTPANPCVGESPATVLTDGGSRENRPE